MNFISRPASFSSWMRIFSALRYAFLVMPASRWQSARTLNSTKRVKASMSLRNTVCSLVAAVVAAVAADCAAGAKGCCGDKPAG